jgi:hypothetical protein
LNEFKLGTWINATAIGSMSPVLRFQPSTIQAGQSTLTFVEHHLKDGFSSERKGKEANMIGYTLGALARHSVLPVDQKT